MLLIKKHGREGNLSKRSKYASTARWAQGSSSVIGLKVQICFCQATAGVKEKEDIQLQVEHVAGLLLSKSVCTKAISYSLKISLKDDTFLWGICGSIAASCIWRHKNVVISLYHACFWGFNLKKLFWNFWEGSSTVWFRLSEATGILSSCCSLLCYQPWLISHYSLDRDSSDGDQHHWCDVNESFKGNWHSLKKSSFKFYLFFY